MSARNEPSIEELRRKVQDQLKQSGMDAVIKKLVENICASKNDKETIDPEEVLQTIYSRGLMGSILQMDSSNRNKYPSKFSQLDAPSMNEAEKDVGTGWMDKNSDMDDHPDSDNAGTRFYLKVNIMGGKAFLDHLSHEKNSSQTTICKSQKLVLHLFFKSKRFKGSPVNCENNPSFQEEFVIDVGHFESGSVSQLLAVKEPLRIIIIREDPNLAISGGGVIISFTLHDWRSVLLTDNGFEFFSLELFGVGLENNVPVGLLNMKIAVLPCPSEQISEQTMLTHLHSEKTIHEESVRYFATFAKQWMNEFLTIRPGHVFRNVKLYAFDERFLSRPMSTFVQLPNNADRVFLTPFHAAWFVSLFSTLPTFNNNDSIHNLQSLDLTIASKSGSPEDLSVLLCSLLLGFGLDAFVAFGSEKNANPTSWVVTFDNSFQPLFWDPLTSKRFKPLTSTQSENINIDIDTKSISRSNLQQKFHNIGCMFNNEAFHCNIQSCDFISSVDWNISNPSKWKCIPSKIISKLPYQTVHSFFLFPAAMDCEFITARIEIEVQELIQEARMQKGLSTRWDATTSKLMGQQLATFELEESTSGSNFDNFFQVVIMRSIPEGYDFKGFHYHSPSTNAKSLFHSCMRNLQCQEVVYCRGEDVRHSIRGLVFSYPENVASIRIMIGCKFIAVQ